MYTVMKDKQDIENGIEVPALTLESILSKLGHSDINFCFWSYTVE
jgi:hypothetical protein